MTASLESPEQDKSGAHSTEGIHGGFLRSAECFPNRPALTLGDESLSYRDLRQWALAMAATMGLDAEVPLTGIFGHRSFAAFAGVLAGLFRGGAYVPLNPDFPPNRNLAMCQRAGLDWIVVEASSLEAFAEMAVGHEAPLKVLVPDTDDIGDLPSRLTRHRFITRSALVKTTVTDRPRDADPDGMAYLLFTSGSTGIPKGVMVAHRNVTWFVGVMAERYGISEHDRLSQTFDLTFDLSAFDMFVAWERGACVCVPTRGEKLFPARYINDRGITVWFSVPSTAVLMKKLRMLKPGNFAGLRYSLFCGEGLPVEIASSFQEAAPNSIVENLYGPTELTIACTLYRFDPRVIDRDAHLGLVPIGEPYPGMSALVVDETLSPVPDGEAGELIMTGPQLSLGYWQDQEKTAAAFVRVPYNGNVYYRTGDRVCRKDNVLLYLGRVDNQIKVKGYRVELGEIEAVVRQHAPTDTAIAVGYPSGPDGVEGIVVFVSMPGRDLDAVQAAARAALPPYMQPSSMIHVDRFPLNANGKVDRRALVAMLETDSTSNNGAGAV